MDLFDDLATRLSIPPETLFDLRRIYGGETYYVHSARREMQQRIRSENAPASVIAKRYGLHRNSVARIRRQ